MEPRNARGIPSGVKRGKIAQFGGKRVSVTGNVKGCPHKKGSLELCGRRPTD